MRVFLTADAHFFEWREYASVVAGVNTRLRAITDALIHSIGEAVNEHGCDTMMFLGDLTHSRASLTHPVVSEVRRFGEYARMMFKHIVAIRGNHDVYLKSPQIDSISLFQGGSNVSVFGSPRGDRNSVFGFIPWMAEKDDFRRELDHFREKKVEYVFGHFGVLGSKVGDGWVVQKAEVGLEDLEGFKGVFLGHYHNHQRLKGNVWYVGSPVPHTWSEEAQEKVYGVLDTETGKVSWHIIPGPSFRKLDLGADGVEAAIDTTNPDAFIKVRVNPDDKKQIRALEKLRAERPNLKVEFEREIKESTARIDVGNSYKDAVAAYIKERPPQASLDRKTIVETACALLSDKDASGHTRSSSIRIKRLRLRHFMSFDNLAFDFENRGLICISGANGAGKCLPGDTELVDAISGEVTTIANLYRGGSRQRAFHVFGLDHSWKLTPTRVLSVAKTGVKKIFSVSLDNGTSVRMSASHPVMTDRGSRRADSLSPGDYVACPREFAVTKPNATMSDDDVVLLAAFIAEGCLATTGYRFSNTDPDIVRLVDSALHKWRLRLHPSGLSGSLRGNWVLGEDDACAATVHDEFMSIVRETGLDLASVFGCNAALVAAGARNPGYDTLMTLYSVYGDARYARIAEILYPYRVFRSWFSALGLHGEKSGTKQVPGIVYTLPTDLLRRFISVYWACDGYVAANGKEVSATTISLELANGIQRILLMLGIPSNLRTRKVTRSTTGFSYTVGVVGRDARVRLCTVLSDCPHSMKRARARNVIETAATVRENNNRDLVPASLVAPTLLSNYEVSGHLSSVNTRSLSQVSKHAYSRVTIGQLAADLGSDDLRRFSESDIIWRRVVSSSDTGVREQTYDIEIDNDTHYYALDNVITHNSALLESILWCLYGKTIRYGSATSNLVNRFVDQPYTRVEVVLDVDGQDVVIQRFAKTKEQDAKILIGGHQFNYDDGQAHIEAYLPPYNVFVNTVFFSSSISRFTEATDAEKKAVIENILGLTMYREAEETAKSRVSGAKVDADLASSTHARTAGSVVALKEAIEAHKGKKPVLSPQHEKEFESAKAEVERVKADVEKAARAVEKADKLRDSVEASVRASDSEKEAELDETGTRLMDDLRVVRERQVEIRTGRKIAAEFASKLRSTKGTCPTCKQSVSLDYVKQAETQAAKDAAESEKQLAQLSVVARDLEEQIARVTVQQKALGKIDDNPKYRKASEKCELADSRLNTAKDLLDTAENRLAAAKETVDRYKVAFDSWQKHGRALSSQRDGAIAAADKAAKEMQGSLARVELYTYVAQMFSAGGLRSFILDTCEADINTEIRQVSRILTGGAIDVQFSATSTTKGGNVRDRVSIVAVNENGSEVYPGNSKGERARIDLCVLLGVRRLALRQSAVRCGTLFMDEVFDGVDPNGAQAVVQLLQEEAATGSTIPLVSHDPNIVGMIADVVTVVKYGNTSGLEASHGQVSDAGAPEPEPRKAKRRSRARG